MAVHLRRDEEQPISAPTRDAEANSAILRQAARQAARQALVGTLLGALLLVGGLAAMRKALLASEKLLPDPGGHWDDMLMPLVIFMIFGGVFGALLIWRITSAVSIDGTIAWLITSLSAGVLAVLGGLAASRIFDAGIPTMAWLALAAVSVTAVCVSRLVIAWTTS
jgi:hypothetical protein